jgi:hypothetical protein
MMAVLKYNAAYNTSIHRKGAAFAANWPDDSDWDEFYSYWIGMFGSAARPLWHILSLSG